MNQDLWNAIDHYFEQRFHPADDALAAALTASEAAGLPNIGVAPNQGRLLEILARSVGAKRILELGTLGGYSTIWLARALPADGKVVTIEFAPKHTEIAAANIRRAKLSDRVDIRVGAGLDVLPQLQAENAGPFDLFFVDADKANIPDYFDWCVRLARKGSLIVIDNVIRSGAILDRSNEAPDVVGVRRFAELAEKDTRVLVTAIQVVGVKGHDGLAVALVVADP
ncbi:MAG: O-methyltransferase [Bauldia sp.]